MGLLSWLHDDSCGAHHWGSWKSTGDVAVFPTGMSNSRAKDVKVKQRRRCKHDCNASETRWTKTGTIRNSELIEMIGGLSKDKQRALEGLIKAAQEKDSRRLELAIEELAFRRSPSVGFEGPSVSVDAPNAYGWDDNE